MVRQRRAVSPAAVVLSKDVRVNRLRLTASGALQPAVVLELFIVNGDGGGINGLDSVGRQQLLPLSPFALLRAEMHASGGGRVTRPHTCRLGRPGPAAMPQERGQHTSCCCRDKMPSKDFCSALASKRSWSSFLQGVWDGRGARTIEPSPGGHCRALRRRDCAALTF